MTVIDVADLRPVAGALAQRLAGDESARYADALRSLRAEAWGAQTDNPDWDVRAMSGHVLGMLQTFSARRRLIRDMAGATRSAGDGLVIDALTRRQVHRNARLSDAELLAELDALGPKQARWRAGRRLMRRMKLNQPHEGTVERWTIGYLVDIILTRDTFMHRIDLHRATGRPIELTAEHDGAIVADVVREWATRHGQPFSLHLTGPAGGTFRSGTGERIELDAVEFCRILSGRSDGPGLLAQKTPF